DDGEIRRPAGHPEDKKAERVAFNDEQIETESTVSGYAGGGGRGMPSPEPDAPRSRARPRPTKAAPPPPPREVQPPSDARVAVGDQKMKQISNGLVHSDKTIVIEGYADGSHDDAQ